jgi:DNA-binding response OmpR family regulator
MTANLYQDDVLTIHSRGWYITRHGQDYPLTPTERAILLLLLATPSQYRPAEEVFETVMGVWYAGAAHSLRNHIYNLRRKVGRAYIQMTRHYGVRFVPQGPLNHDASHRPRHRRLRLASRL